MGAVVVAWLNEAGPVAKWDEAAQGKGSAEARGWEPASGSGGQVAVKVGSGESGRQDLPPPPP